MNILDTSPSCPSDNLIEGSCFTAVSDLMLSWTEAKSTCQTMTGGRGSLAVVESSAVEMGLLPILMSTGLAI